MPLRNKLLLFLGIFFFFSPSVASFNLYEVYCHGAISFPLYLAALVIINLTLIASGLTLIDQQTGLVRNSYRAVFKKEKTTPIEIVRMSSILAHLAEEKLFISNPRLLPISQFDASHYEKQPCDIDGINFEWVNQRTVGQTGDEFSGTLAWFLNINLMFVVDYG